jgi:Na+-driven multidrug efflux pump
MRTVMLLFPLVGFQVVSANVFVVTGRPKISILLSMLRQCIVLIPCMLLFGRLWGLYGVIAAAPVADGFSLILTALMIFFELKKLRAAP